MNSSLKGDVVSPERCHYCGQPAGMVWVHSHGQCAACGTNVDECCRGESHSVLSIHRKDTGQTGRT